MKKLMIMAAGIAMLAACSRVDLDSNANENANAPTKAFTFHVKGDFTTNYDDMTRAAVRIEENNTTGITDIWILDYVNGALVQQVHQGSSQTGITFGSVPMALTYGHHDIKLIASKGADPVLTATALTWGRVKDTFVLDYPVDVVASSNSNRAPELKRAVSGLKVVMTDAVPQDAKWIVLTLGSRSQSLTLPALSALPYSESSVELDCSGNRSVKNASATIYTLAGDEEWTSTASIAVKREDGSVITSFDLPEVVLRKNRITTLTGEVFNRTSGFSVAIDDSWEESVNAEF